MDVRVAKRYARALFNAATKAGVVESVESDLKSLTGLVQSDNRIRDFFFSPHVARDEKIRIATSVFSDRVTALTMHVVRLMLTKRREAELTELYDQFVILRREQEGVQAVDIVSSIELTDDQKKRLVAKLEQKSGKRVEATFRTENGLIGGIKVGYGNYMLDGSARGTLDRLRDKLRIDLLKQTN